MRQRTVVMYVEIGCFVSCLCGWVLNCSTLATEYWVVSESASVVLSAGDYYSNLWMDCVTDTTGVSDSKYYPSVMDLPGEEKIWQYLMIWCYRRIINISLSLVVSFPKCMQGPRCRLCDLWLLVGCSCPHRDEMYQNRRLWACQRQSYLSSSVDVHGICYETYFSCFFHLRSINWVTYVLLSVLQDFVVW